MAGILLNLYISHRKGNAAKYITFFMILFPQNCRHVSLTSDIYTCRKVSVLFFCTCVLFFSAWKFIVVLLVFEVKTVVRMDLVVCLFSSFLTESGGRFWREYPGFYPQWCWRVSDCDSDHGWFLTRLHSYVRVPLSAPTTSFLTYGFLLHTSHGFTFSDASQEISDGYSSPRLLSFLCGGSLVFYCLIFDTACYFFFAILLRCILLHLHLTPSPHDLLSIW